MGQRLTYQHTESIFFEIRRDITTYRQVNHSCPLLNYYTTIDDVIYFYQSKKASNLLFTDWLFGQQALEFQCGFNDVALSPHGSRYIRTLYVYRSTMGQDAAKIANLLLWTQRRWRNRYIGLSGHSGFFLTYVHVPGNINVHIGMYNDQSATREEEQECHNVHLLK